LAGPAEIEDFPAVPNGPFSAGEIATLRIRAESLEPGNSLFLGFAESEDVDAYLASIPHAIVEEVDRNGLLLTYHIDATEASIAPPTEQPIWIQSKTGTEEPTLEWAVEEGDFSFVVMHEDATDGMALTADVGVRVPILGPLGVGLLLGGAVTLAVGTLLLAIALQSEWSSRSIPSSARKSGRCSRSTSLVHESSTRFMINRCFDESGSV